MMIKNVKKSMIKELILYQRLKLSKFIRLVNIEFYLQMLKYSPTNPENFIANRQQLEQHQCSLCFQFTLNMRHCAGPCQKYFCTFCLRQREGDGEGEILKKCLFCGKRLQLEVAQPPIILFRCPSNNTKCNALIRSKQELLAHASQCSFINKSSRRLFRNRVNSICRCGGKLRFSKQVAANCFECGLQSSSSACNSCGLCYCLICRKSPISKEFCMRGHRFIKKKVKNFNTICDICDIPIFGMHLKKSYHDRQCDFDICQYCHKNLPKDPPKEFEDYQHESIEEDQSDEDQDEEREEGEETSEEDESEEESEEQEEEFSGEEN